MGSGTSLLSPEDSTVLTQILREEYDKLMGEGFSENEIQSKLTNKYNEIIASISTEPSTVTEEPMRPGSEGSDGTGRKKRRTLHGNQYDSLCLQQSSPSIRAPACLSTTEHPILSFNPSLSQVMRESQIHQMPSHS